MFEKVFSERRDLTSSDSFDWTKWSTGDELDERMDDSTYTRCLNILANLVGKIAYEVKQDTEKGEIILKNHPLYELLRLRPNSSMSSFDCFSSLIRMYKHYGQAGLYIDKGTYSGKIKGLYPVKIDGITVDDTEGLINSKRINKVMVDFTCLGKSGYCSEDNIIILRDNSFNGIEGKADKTYLKDTLISNSRSRKYQKELFNNGLTNKLAVQLVSDIKESNELTKIQNKFNRMYSSNGRVFTIPAGYQVTPLNLSLADSQFAQLKILGKKEVSSVIGIPYSLVDDMKNISEDDILSMVSISIHPILVALEQESDYKLLSKKDRNNNIKCRFNFNGLLRTTPKTQQEIICNYVKQGVYSLNYAKKIVGAELLEKDVTVFPSGQVTLDQLIKGKVSYVKNNKKEGDE